MSPIIIEENEFVISFDITTGNIKLRNPQGKENDGNFLMLKELVKGLVANTQKTTSETPVAIDAETPDKPARLVVKDSQFYKDLLEMKAVYDKLHSLGVPEGGFYRAIIWILERINWEVAKPYSETPPEA